MEVVNLVECIDEHEKCKLCYAYFCKYYITWPKKSETCRMCKHKDECTNTEWSELENYEPLDIN